MFSFLCLLSLQLRIFKNDSEVAVKLCVNESCSAKSFTGTFSALCPEYLPISNEFNVYGLTSDDEYYVIKVDETEYFVKKFCVENKSEIEPTTVPVQISSFNDIDILRKKQLSKQISQQSLDNSDQQLTKLQKLVEEQKNKPSSILDPLVNLNGNGPKPDDSEGSQKIDKSFQIPIPKNVAAEIPVMDSSTPKNEIDRAMISDDPIYLEEDKENRIHTFLNKMKADFDHYLTAVNYYINRMPNFDPKVTWSFLISLDRITIFSITTVVLFLLFVYQTITKYKSSYYMISYNNLSRLYSERLKILEENECNLRAQLNESKNMESAEIHIVDQYQDEIKNLRKQLCIANQEKEIISEKLNSLQTEFVNLDEAGKNLKASYQDTVSKKNLEIENLQNEISNKTKTLTSLTHELEESKIALAKLTAEKETLSHSYEDAQKYLDNFVGFFMSENISIDGLLLHESILDLKAMNKHDVNKALFKISKQLAEYDAFKKDSICMNDISKECTSLKETQKDLQEEISRLHTELDEAHEKFHDSQVEFKAIKKHYKETESGLYEQYNQEKNKVVELEAKLKSINDESAYLPEMKKTINDLKLEISSLEVQMRKMKEEHSMELNSQYVINKKLEREFDRVNSEKENYRIKLLKVLRENQSIENEKNDDSEVKSKRSSYTASSIKSIDSTVKSSYFRNSIDLVKPPSLPPPMMPPPPILPPFAAPPFGQPPYAFFPNDVSSPRPDNSYFMHMPYAMGSDENASSGHHVNNNNEARRNV